MSQARANKQATARADGRALLLFRRLAGACRSMALPPLHLQGREHAPGLALSPGVCRRAFAAPPGG